MRVAIVDSYYLRFLSTLYREKSELRYASYESQIRDLLATNFGTSDYYSRHLNDLGCEAQDLIVNCVPLQKRWAREHGIATSFLAMHMPRRTFRLPVVGYWLSSLPGLMEVAIAQIKAFKPDVLYSQDINFFPTDILKQLKNDVRLIVGQIASPLPPDSYLKGYDLILTSFPHFVPRLRDKGIASEYFRIGFDERILEKLGEIPKDVDASFVGGISSHHGKAVPLLENLAGSVDMSFFGYGARTLPWSSPVRKRHRGEVWGVDMYRALARSRITLNRHINVAENYANNMRLYEATGVGTLLLTDRKDNLGDLFEVGKEVIAYSSASEAAELIRHYLAHPDEAQAIARAGQARTLREHTYKHRMAELVPILEKHLQRFRT